MAEMMELAGKDIKIAVINLINIFTDVKHKLNYERNRRHKKKTQMEHLEVENTIAEKQINCEQKSLSHCSWNSLSGCRAITESSPPWRCLPG